MGKLAELKEGKKLPIIIQVHTGMEPFLKDSGGGAAGGSGGWHVVTITGFEPPNKVAIDNQWGEAKDHTGANMVNTHDLYLCTLDTEKTAQKTHEQVAWNKAHHQVDTNKSLDDLRFQHATGQLDNEDYVK